MSERPRGTVTFLFTDVEGSTQLLQELGDRYRDALDDHRRLLRGAFVAHGGFEVDTQGDAFFVAFDRAQDAVRTAGDAQRALAAHSWPDGRALRVRMGVHTCEATATEEGYVGIGVHRGARICAAAHGGQVLLSQTTRDLLGEQPAGLGLRDLGEHRLKDLTEPHRLYQLFGDGLQADFPPLRTLENRPTNLPVQPTPLVGRAREVVEIGDLLRRADTRLVTLTGPGGTGKTRLALQAAAELVDEFPNDGVFFVTLAPIVDPALVVPTIAQTLGINEAAGQSFSAYVAAKKLLLVLDNFEQVIAAAPQLAELLTQAPDVKLIVTSREPVRVSAEQVYPVSPLALPDPRHLPELPTLSRYESVALFIERAQAVQPSFELTSANAPAVAEICVRLDGLPLALELAAARIPLLSPHAMLERLDQRLRLLTGGARDLPERQQTLRDTLAWSYDLLTADEQQLFARLGVFAGGFTLDAAEEVCGAGLDELASLVDKSLVRREGERFTTLETIREYARERLEASREQDDLRARHTTYFLRLAESVYPDRWERETEWSERLEDEHDNLRVALEWLSTRDQDRYLRLTGALGWFWHVHSHFAEGRQHLAAALAGSSDRDAGRARALAAAGELAGWQADLPAAQTQLEEALALWRELGDLQEAAFVLHDLGWSFFIAGDSPAGRDRLQESLDLQREIGNPTLVNRAQVGLTQMLVSLGEVELVEKLGQESRAFAIEHGDLRSEHYADHFLADCPLIRGDCEAAQRRYRRALESALKLGDRFEAIVEVQGIAMATAGLSRPEEALRLAGAASAVLDSLGIDISGIQFWSDLLERYLGPARVELGPDAADAAWEGGRHTSFERAVDEALETVK